MVSAAASSWTSSKIRCRTRLAFSAERIGRYVDFPDSPVRLSATGRRIGPHIAGSFRAMFLIAHRLGLIASAVADNFATAWADGDIQNAVTSNCSLSSSSGIVTTFYLSQDFIFGIQPNAQLHPAFRGRRPVNVEAQLCNFFSDDGNHRLCSILDFS